MLSSFQLDAIEGTISLEETRCAQVSRHQDMSCPKIQLCQGAQKAMAAARTKVQATKVYSAPFHHGLVGGFRYFLFSPLPGEIIQFD